MDILIGVLATIGIVVGVVVVAVLALGTVYAISFREVGELDDIDFDGEI
jgi:hypothetical protein